MLAFASPVKIKYPLIAQQILVLALFPAIAIADENDTFQFRAGINKSFDSNVLRQSKNEVSDQITFETLGVKFDKKYSLQRVIFDVSYNEYSYQKSDFLNYHATNYSGAWLWSLTPSLHGNLSSSKTQSLISFRDLLTPTKNIRTTTTNTFGFEYSPHNVWALIGSISEIENNNSRQFSAQTSSKAYRYEYGVKYSFPSGSNISLTNNHRRGEFQGRQLNPVLQFDNGYEENEVDLAFEKVDDGKSTLNAKLGYLNREYNNFSERDYKSFLGSLDYMYTLTGKVKLDLNLSRFVGVFETATSTYTITDAVRAGVFYDVTGKIQSGLNLRLSTRDFEGRGQFDTSGRLDKERSVSAFVSWNPLRNVGITLRTTKSYRDSTVNNFDFDDLLTSVNVDLAI